MFIFILVLEGLHVAIMYAIYKRIIKGFRVGVYGYKVYQILFVEDTIFIYTRIVKTLKIYILS